MTKLMQPEDPKEAEGVLDEVDRRSFLGVMGASMALAGVSTSLTGCVRKPREKVLAYTRRPEDLVPGEPRYFATAAQLTGGVIGLLVESQDGRPTKVEGNPRHPMSLGATDAFTQASVLDLYDPARVKLPRVEGKVLPFSALEERFEHFKTNLGDGEALALLIDGQESPTLFSLLYELRRSHPKVKIYRHDNACPRNGVAGAGQVGIRGTRPLYALERADRVLCLDMDFLGVEGDVVRNARHYAWRRRITSERDTMNRLYVVEPAFSVTGTNADHRLRLAPSQVGEFLADLIGHMASRGVNAPAGARRPLHAAGRRLPASR
ncbi:MAG: hypothetical protein JRH20_18785 [Deltaproteobacteria bacterium]|nr:hypothetical protein [Deltaproteobacteria bacterium]